MTDLFEITANGHDVFDEGRDLSVPPHDDEAERAVFGSMLKSPRAVREVADLLEAKDFYSPKHQAIWKAVLALEAANTPIDYHLLADQLRKHGDYEVAGGLLYLSEISLATPTAAFIVHYARIVVRMAIQRRIISLSQKLAEAAWRDDKDPADLMDEMVRRMNKLNSRAAEHDVVDAAESADAMMAALVDERGHAQAHDKAKGPYMAGWRTGLADLDRTLLGMKPGDLIYLAARTSVGKSILALQIAIHVANQGGPVYFTSLEMNVMKLLHRCMTMQTGIPRHEIARGNLSDVEYQAVMDAATKFRKLPIMWDTTSRNVEQIQRKMLRWQDQMDKPIALAVVDYVQLLRDTVSQRSSRYENVSLASHNLKQLAEALNVVVFAPAQVSREVLKRTSKMPDLSDLRESGDLEQDADVVLGLDRADYHNQNADDHTATLAVLKARDLANDRGRGTIVPLVWLEKFERYGSAEKPQNNVVPFRKPQPVLHDDLEAQRFEAQDDGDPPPPESTDPLPW